MKIVEINPDPANNHLSRKTKTELCYFCRCKVTCKLGHLVRVIELNELCYLYAPQTSQGDPLPNALRDKSTKPTMDYTRQGN